MFITQRFSLLLVFFYVCLFCIIACQEAQLLMAVLHRFFKWRSNPRSTSESQERYKSLQDSFFTPSSNLVRFMNALHQQARLVTPFAANSHFSSSHFLFSSVTPPLPFLSPSWLQSNFLNFAVARLLKSALDASKNLKSRSLQPDPRCSLCRLSR